MFPTVEIVLVTSFLQKNSRDNWMVETVVKEMGAKVSILIIIIQVGREGPRAKKVSTQLYWQLQSQCVILYYRITFPVEVIFGLNILAHWQVSKLITKCTQPKTVLYWWVALPNTIPTGYAIDDYLMVICEQCMQWLYKLTKIKIGFFYGIWMS